MGEVRESRLDDSLALKLVLLGGSSERRAPRD